MNKYIYRFATEQEFVEYYNNLLKSPWPFIGYIEETETVLYNFDVAIDS